MQEVTTNESSAFMTYELLEEQEEARIINNAVGRLAFKLYTKKFLDAKFPYHIASYVLKIIESMYSYSIRYQTRDQRLSNYVASYWLDIKWDIERMRAVIAWENSDKYREAAVRQVEEEFWTLSMTDAERRSLVSIIMTYHQFKEKHTRTEELFDALLADGV